MRLRFRVFLKSAYEGEEGSLAGEFNDSLVCWRALESTPLIVGKIQLSILDGDRYKSYDCIDPRAFDEFTLFYVWVKESLDDFYAR
jgi:hypothetical protein